MYGKGNERERDLWDLLPRNGKTKNPTVGMKLGMSPFNSILLSLERFSL